ncbi:MAG: PTS ascorbate transporter subunit IIC [Sphaerochaetaceae bacterium]|nr:PTS ascorbate transporter subunit IIC [Sphaerochaetaceae bacterium]MDC7236833.1 PTS ascorbate transporter subunit IIC [Sphaerochaetaceae bacterium]MDC7248843.1 PTS ascorbate transporter subunit IIC [Sphaerochaetaceae bacterium]
MSEKKKTQRKQIPLRLSSSLYEELVEWAEQDFRSVNGQIEYLLYECVKKRKKRIKSNLIKKEEYDAVDK